MTAEIAIMNKEAIALAADSAVTIADGYGEKVFTSANKLFALSKHEPVAAMVYGNATLNSVPWEAIIKLYRKELNRTRFGHVEEYAKHFLKFLKQHTKFFPEDKCHPFFADHLATYFEMVLHEVTESQGLSLPGQPTPPPPDPQRLEQAFEEQLSNWKSARFLPTATSADRKKLRPKYKPLIDQVIDGVFKDIQLTSATRKSLIEIGLFALVKCPESLEWHSTAGLVIAGFGQDEVFPALRSFSVHGVFGGHLNYSPKSNIGIGFDKPAAVRPFAQDDVVYAFMEGVDPKYQRLIQRSTAKLLDLYPAKVIDQCDFLGAEDKAKLKEKFAAVAPQLAKDHFDVLARHRGELFWRKMLSLLAVLPKAELASLAESMVMLTSQRRRMDSGIETVAGPVDVALVSKGDGFIWVKRKHYFPANLNHHFFNNYYADGAIHEATKEQVHQ